MFAKTMKNDPRGNSIRRSLRGMGARKSGGPAEIHKLLERDKNHPIEKVGEELRKQMSWLKPGINGGGEVARNGQRRLLVATPNFARCSHRTDSDAVPSRECAYIRWRSERSDNPFAALPSSARV